MTKGTATAKKGRAVAGAFLFHWLRKEVMPIINQNRLLGWGQLRS